MLRVVNYAGGRLKNPREQGFTLIEISIVLVIIGLIVGGALVGHPPMLALQS
jgi:prepilin-type N-terminal cleavage/methylation domain-containing protein